jgi:AcrR family transcriptional regulator
MFYSSEIIMREFAGKEKELIRLKMLENGKKAFSKSGIKKTSIEEITKSVGIAKGSFYIFFDSKEELYFQILMDEIARSMPAQFDLGLNEKVSPKQRVGRFLREAVASMDSNPILKLMLDPEEYTLVARRLATVEDGHPEVDIVYPLTRLLSKWQEDGIIVQQDTNLLANVIKGVFLLTTHRDEIGEEIYPAVMDFYIDMITDQITEKNKTDRSNATAGGDYAVTED